MLCFHPLASDILATAAYDGKILIWNVAKQQVEITLDPIEEPVMRQGVLILLSYSFTPAFCNGMEL